LRHGEDLPSLKSRNITIGQVWPLYKEYLQSQNKTDTVRAMESAYKHYLSRFAHVPIRAITKRDVRQALTIWSRGLKKSTVNNKLRKLQTLINWAIKEGLYRGTNPIKGLSYLPTNDKRDRWLTREEAGALIAALRKADTELAMQAIISLMTGARINEILQMTIENIDWDAEVCFIPKSKGHQDGRYLFLSGCIDEISDYIDRTHIKEGPLFPQQKFKSALFALVVMELGLNKGITDSRRKCVFHTLRHTCASWLVQSGTDILTVSKILGHKSVTHTMRYAHLAPEQQQDAVARLGESFKRY